MNVTFQISNLKLKTLNLSLIMLVFVVCNLYFGILSKVFAQEITTELTVSPPVAYIKIKPGNKTRHTITITNTSDVAVTVSPSLVDFKPDPKTGRPTLSQATTFPYLDTKLETMNNLALAPNQKAQLTLEFSVPQFAQEKEFPLTILFKTSTKANTAISTSQAQIESSIGSNLIVLIASDDELTPNLSIANFNLPTIRDSLNTIDVRPIAQNNTFHASTASGSARLKNWRGETVASYAIYPDVILGQSSRPLRFITSLDQALDENTEPGIFQYKPLFLLGVYTLEIEFIHAGQTPSAIYTKSFVALPIGILLLLAILGGGWGGYFIYKRRQTTF